MSENRVHRYKIFARYIGKKTIYTPLYKDGRRTFSSLDYAKKVVRKTEEHRPELEFKIKAIIQNTCSLCGQVTKNRPKHPLTGF